MILFVFFIVVICLSQLSYSKTLANNEKRRKSVIKQSHLLNGEQGAKALEQLMKELDFALATIECNFPIEKVKNLFTEHRQDIELFCAINDITTCFHDYFAIIGNFVGTEIIPGKHKNRSITKLYSADILFRKNDNNTLTLLSTFPENKDHDFFIKDFIIRLKEVLK